MKDKITLYSKIFVLTIFSSSFHFPPNPFMRIAPESSHNLNSLINYNNVNQLELNPKHAQRLRVWVNFEICLN